MPRLLRLCLLQCQYANATAFVLPKFHQHWLLFNICKPYYCDLGYYFDKSQNKCITDICTENNYDENEDKNEKGKLETWHIIFIVVGLILILGIIGVVLYFVKFRKKNTPVKIDTIAESDYILGGDNDTDKDE